MKNHDDERRRVRDVLERATAEPRPRMEELVEAVPDLMARARRRPVEVPPVDALSAAVPLAWKAIPAMATAAALLLAASAALYATGTDGSTGAGNDLDTLILGESEAQDAAERILETLVAQENGNG
jgi:hypothetical protein